MGIQDRGENYIVQGLPSGRSLDGSRHLAIDDRIHASSLWLKAFSDKYGNLSLKASTHG